MTDKSPFDLKALGQAVRHVRTQKGWTQEMLSEVSTHTQRTISSIERGEISTTIVTLENVARALDTNAHELIKLGHKLKMDNEHCIRRVFSANLKSARKMKGFSQSELARKTGIALSYINKLEAAKYSVTIDRIEVFAAVLNVSESDLLKRN